MIDASDYMELYDDKLLTQYKEKAPFITHPYEYWRTRRGYEGAYNMLKEMVKELSKEKEFHARVCQARKNINDPLDFYGFLAEIKVAHFLKSRSSSFEILKSKSCPMPDFKADGIYIETNMPIKSFPYIQRLEEKLRMIDSRFCFDKRHYAPIDFPNKVECPGVYDEIKGKLSEYAHKQISKNSVEIWRSGGSKNPLLGVLVDPNLEPPAGFNQQSDPTNSVRNFLAESLKAKIKKENKKLKRETISNGKFKYVLENGLQDRHPNMLWSEFMYLSDFQNRNCLDRYDWEKYGLPADLDSQIITVTDFDKGIASNPPSVEILETEGFQIPLHCGFKEYIFLNRQANGEDFEKVN